MEVLYVSVGEKKGIGIRLLCTADDPKTPARKSGLGILKAQQLETPGIHNPLI